MHLRLNFWKRVCLLLTLFVTTLTISVSCTPNQTNNSAPEVDITYIFGPKLEKSLFTSNDNSSQPLIDLGRQLYYDKRLSKNQDISCNSCHLLENYGVDNLPTSPGHKGQLGARNSPSVYHAAAHLAQFWDGRAATVEEQAKGPILNPGEMAMPSEAKVLEVVNSIPEYVSQFKTAFASDSNPVTYDNLGKAIGAFEKGLVTPSPFDKYFAGDKNALNAQQKRGLNLFVQEGCVTCHNGTYFGGQMFRKVGQMKPWPNQKDLGRYEVTKQEADKMVFKVPSLRNVAKTNPYFHDGSAKTLEEAVQIMTEYQLGKQLAANELKDLVAFLESLTGDIPQDYVKEPQLPASTAKTPKPDPS
jgi:cytochrome c peroxidase